MPQRTTRVWGEPDPRADFPQLRAALKNFDAETRLPESDGNSKPTNARPHDDNCRSCFHDVSGNSRPTRPGTIINEPDVLTTPQGSTDSPRPVEPASQT